MVIPCTRLEAVAVTTPRVDAPVKDVPPVISRPNPFKLVMETRLPLSEKLASWIVLLRALGAPPLRLTVMDVSVVILMALPRLTLSIVPSVFPSPMKARPPPILSVPA